MNRYRNKQRGLTIIEILVALAIGLVLTAGVIQVYLSSNQSYRLQESLSRIQESGRYALELLARDMRMVQFDSSGCGGGYDNTTITLNNHDPNNEDDQFKAMLDAFSGTSAIIGHGANEDGSWTPDFALSVTDPKPGSDAFTMIDVSSAMSSAPPVEITNDPGGHGGAATIQVSNNDQFDACDLVIIVSEDCSSVALLQAVKVSGPQNVIHNTGDHCGDTAGGGNATQQLGAGFQGGQAMNASGQQRAVFYIRETDGFPGLWSHVEGGTPRERVEGVERMAMRYGVDTNGNHQVNEYLTAQEIDNSASIDWTEVVAVRISLLLTSRETNIVDEPQSIVFAGDTVDTSDRRLRQVFTTTVGLRNRLK